MPTAIGAVAAHSATAYWDQAYAEPRRASHAGRSVLIPLASPRQGRQAPPVTGLGASRVAGAFAGRPG
jgi:hypothetical protein